MSPARCGRTLFNLQTTTAKIKAATVHLKGVKIAIMGCIVNGPGEMADADFGYVGGAPGKVNLYVGKTGGEIQYSRGRSGRSIKGFDSRARQVGGTGDADSRARTRFIAQRKLFKARTRSDSIPGATESALSPVSERMSTLQKRHYKNLRLKGLTSSSSKLILERCRK